VAYGRYCGYRDAAWRCLYDYQIDRLPVDVLRIASDAGIRVMPDSGVGLLRTHQTGMACYDGARWTIVYDGMQTMEACRFTIAHELGHIFLGHGLKMGEADEAPREEIGKQHEREADHFAVRLLCPACMLWALDLHTAEEIAAVCRVPLEVAKKRAARMTTLYKRGQFLHSSLERDVFRRFEGYLAGERERNGLPALCFDIEQ
jgi:Zn-dependent peptidase ImmA (M78 family)